MKKLIYCTLALVFAHATSFGQDNAIAKYFSDFENRDDATTLALSGKAFGLAQEMKTDENTPSEMGMVKELASKVTGLTVVYCDKVTNANQLANTASNRVKNSFEDLLVVKNGETLLRIMINDLNGSIKEVLVVAGKGESLLVASLTGDLNLSDVGSLTKTISEAGSKWSGEMGNVDELMVYPNPAKQGVDVRIKLTKELENAPVRIYDISGHEVMASKAVGRELTIRTNGLKPGVYVVKTASGNAEMAGKFIVE